MLRRLLMLLMLCCFQVAANAADQITRLKIATTVSPITNIVQNVGGAIVDVKGVVPDGMDSHTFEPLPSDAKLLQEADLIIVNGLDLELPTLQLAEKVKKAQVPILQLGNQAISHAEWYYDFSFPRELGHPNPHLWLNIELVMRYVKLIRDQLAVTDPANKASYARNADIYLGKLNQLDQAIFTCITSIPEKNRKLVTYHDSFAYFAPRYGMKVIAAIQPHDFSEPGPQEVINIIKQIRSENVPAIFGSDVFPSKVMAQIAREAKVKFIDQLSEDELPPPPNHSFIGMMANNMMIMTDALGGDKTCMAEIDVSNISF
ncbi:MAG: zinc ABC transporter substrate-binding protein [Nitrosomonas sp.]|nr:zinc ABC transporter substrate-binding protein [Nitrosomonas sp.]